MQFCCAFAFWQFKHRHPQQQVKPYESSANKQNGKHIQTIRAIRVDYERARFPADWSRKACWSQSRPLGHSSFWLQNLTNYSEHNTTVVLLLLTSDWHCIWKLKLSVSLSEEKCECSLPMQNSLPCCYAVVKWLLLLGFWERENHVLTCNVIDTKYFPYVFHIYYINFIQYKMGIYTWKYIQ